MTVRLTALISGLLMTVAHARLYESVVFRMEMGKSFLWINSRESLFWLSHYLLLVPGLLLVAWALAPRLGPMFARLFKINRELDRNRRLALTIGLGLLLFLCAWLGRALWLLDLPITNDEYTIQFGARILLEGSVTASDIDPAYGFPMPWVYRHDGRIASMDFPGTILLTAASMATGLGKYLFMLLAAVSGATLISVCARLDGTRGFCMAAVCWLMSPMVATLSMTMHSHLVSRSFVALVFAAYVVAMTERELAMPKALALGSLIGLGTAAGFVSRPAEVVAVLAPLGLDLVLRARKAGPWRALALSAAGMSLLGPGLMAWWNLQTTGRWHVSARVLGTRGLESSLGSGMLDRLGENLGFNLMMLTLWFIGPLVMVLVALALQSGERLARVAGAGVACQLLLALLHDLTGIRVVGPIHYSEAAVPLLLLAVLGLQRAVELLQRLKIDLATPVVLLVFYLGSLGAWTWVHAGSLVDQAIIHRTPLDAVAHLKNAIVIADRPSQLWFSRPELKDVSSWLADLPHPDPFLRDNVLFAYPEADVELLRRDFPDRELYRLTYHSEGELVRVRPLDP